MKADLRMCCIKDSQRRIFSQQPVYTMKYPGRFLFAIVLAAIAITVGMQLYKYNSSKGAVTDGMSGNQVYDQTAALAGSQSDDASASAACCTGMNANFQAAEPLGQNENYAAITGVTSGADGLPPSCSQGNIANPADLLPRNSDSEKWAQLNPGGAGSLGGVNLLKAGSLIGVDTTLGSLRNANLQVRSEPPNPQVSVGPWNNTTITPELSRRPLEVGCGPL
jgi:hypothetical protein